MSTPVVIERESSWADMRSYFGSEPYKAQLRYLESERALCVSQLIVCDEEIEVRRHQGAIRLLDKMIAGMKKQATTSE